MRLRNDNHSDHGQNKQCPNLSSEKPSGLLPLIAIGMEERLARYLPMAFRDPYQYRHLQFCPLLMPHLFRPFELRQKSIHLHGGHGHNIHCTS